MGGNLRMRGREMNGSNGDDSLGAGDLLAHLVATLRYRTAKALIGAPAEFGAFEAGAGVRTPTDLLEHMISLLAFTRSALTGAPRPGVPDEPWGDRMRRFDRDCVDLAGTLAGRPVTAEAARRLAQGPLADALTHAGQLALLRRLAGAPIPAEDFSRADIRVPPPTSS